MEASILKVGLDAAAVARWNNDDDLWLLRFIYEQVALIAPTLASRKVIKLRLLLNDFLPRDT